MIKNTKLKIMIKKFTSIAICALLFMEGVMFYNHYSYAHHIAQAKGDIHMLKNTLENNIPNTGLKASVLGIFNMNNGKNNEIQLRNLSNKIVDSTEFAIEIADDIKAVKKLEKAINEINEVQLKSIDTIQRVIEKIEDESISEEVKITYSTAVSLKEKVNQANEEIRTALDNNQEKIEINIVTSKDRNHHGHEEEITENEEHPVKLSAVDIQTEKKKKEDVVQRAANTERIKIIEKGKNAERAAKKSRDLEKRIKKAQKERAAREKGEK